MVHRNQFFVGVITGVLVSMMILGVFHMRNSPTDMQPSSQTVLRIESDGAANQILPEHVGTQISKGNTNTPLPLIEGLLPAHSDNHQEDDTSLADYLYTKVKILCWIMTSPSNLQKKAIHVYETWAHKCNIVIFVSKVETEEGRQHLTAKTMHAFKYVYDNYFDKADWFMKADDDTFAIMENLRYFLADKNPMDPVYYGHHFKTIVKPQGYYSGGGGYVLSKEALQRFADKGFHQNLVCREDGGAEDAEFGKCTHIHGGYPNWYLIYDSHGARHGVDKVSDYPITFHYVSPEEMRSLAWYTYHLKVYGHRERSYPKLHEYYTKK
ncbi:hypothetical protein EB796_014135 [Bugula neritina]|uniref:N-acetylgalactosaminide beta-1,3-galactosyltransferase n=1 Tax=Bugula neritina TaxID=10212 RepID=A0A7J7JPK0_BUGNE|nr:hypothetical protein EB796_014135 [Bugula neritina]